MEGANKLILNLLKKKVEGAKGKWADILSSILCALRTTPSSSTGKTPFALSHGSEAMLSVEIEVPTWRVVVAATCEEEVEGEWIKSNLEE